MGIEGKREEIDFMAMNYLGEEGKSMNTKALGIIKVLERFCVVLDH